MSKAMPKPENAAKVNVKKLDQKIRKYSLDDQEIMNTAINFSIIA